MKYGCLFTQSQKTIIEKIENELRPLENTFLNLLKQDNINSSTKNKIIKNLEAFQYFRKISQPHITFIDKKQNNIKI